MKRSVDGGTAGLIGVVLCGGESRRMGRDKGLIERDGVCWAVRMGRMLASLGLPAVYSIRAGQADAYSAVLPEGCLIADAMEIGGPLNGLLSVHRRFVERDLLLLACDMQNMDEETIGELVGVYRSDRGFDCYVYEVEGSVQPFCAVYTGDWLAGVCKEMHEDRSLRGLIRKGRVRRLEVRRGEAFGNYNSL
jgi:molybdopterin-guanine dinucleotide biosynthesis protein A